MKSTSPNAGEPFRANPVLRTGDPADGRRKRSPVVASAVLHIVLVAAFLVLPGPFMTDDEPEPVKIVFYSPEELERPVELPPVLPAEGVRDHAGISVEGANPAGNHQEG